MTSSLFGTRIKGKVIIASIVACAALGLAWYVSKFTFTEVLHTVENIAAPNDKLTIVNRLSRKVTRLDQLQRTMAIDRQSYNKVFFKEFRELGLTLDTLELLYAGNSAQIKRIRSMKRLLLQRRQLFINYLGVRKEMVDNTALSDQVETLNGMLLNRVQKTDSTKILTTKKRVSTTTVFPAEKENSGGFLSKIFGRKKSPRNYDQGRVVNEELDITVDTIPANGPDSTLNEVKQAVLDIEKQQLKQSERFVTRETALALAANKLTSQTLDILQQVEEEVMRQSVASHQQARKVVNASIKHINSILVLFLLLTATLLYLILTDISKSNSYRKELELAKEEAEYHGMAKQRFLSNMSHEIRTPLQAIIGYTELMRNGYVSKPNIDAIYHSSAHLLQIVNEVLDYSRIISGKFSFNYSVFNLKDLLEEVVSVMRLPAKEKSLGLLTHLDLSPSEFVNGDAFRLRQILYNLLSNAVKFTDAGTITLSASCKHYNGGTHLMLSVQDTGIGIADEDLKRIFNEFDQGRVSGRAAVASGSGLGLSIVKALAENQGGRIYVKSKPGEGSCFTLYMRLETAGQKKIPEQSKSLERPVFDGKVWVVDDDAFILQLCSAILENNGIEHICFDNPQKVLAEPWDKQVKYIFLDMRMPGMNGAELCSLLRKNVSADTRIYALTAQVFSKEYPEVLPQGFDGLLMKPFSEAGLINLLNSAPKFTQTDTSQSDLPDYEALQKMAFGDEAQVEKILRRFTIDTEDDILQLNTALRSHDTEKITLLLHRIAGRTAQIGSRQLASEFRRLELSLREGRLHAKHLDMIRQNLGSLAELSACIKGADAVRHADMV